MVNHILLDAMDFQAAKRYLDELEMFGMKLGLDNMKKLMLALGEPMKGRKVVHVAGTVGKGSISSMIASVLTEAGKKTGLYTSPHIRSIVERIVVDRTTIPETDFVRLLEKVKAVADTMSPKPTFFEVTTALAFLYFEENAVDYAVIEVGMGGRLDATNVLTPVLTVIATVDMEHVQYLGNTLTDIAREKAGIIKDKVPVVIGEMKDEALDIIEGIAKIRNSPIIKRSKSRVVTTDERGMDMIITDPDGRIFKIHIDTYGRFQANNAALAVSALEALGIKETKWVERGIEKVSQFLRGRLERVNNDPPVYVDVGHNPISMEKLTLSLHTLPGSASGQDIILVMGIMADKDHKGMMRAIATGCNRVYICKPRTKRAGDPAKPALEAEKLCEDVIIVEDVKEAIKAAMAHAKVRGGIVCVTGSFYTVSEAMDLFSPIEKRL